MTEAGEVPSLDAARWKRVAELFAGAADLPPDEQDAWIELHAGDDPGLVGTLRRMLAADRNEGGLLVEGVASAAYLGLEPEPPMEPGTPVGSFDIIGELGRGGMGVVYAAVDRHLGRPAALKFLPRRAIGEGDGAERLIAEAKAASGLDHPNVATVYQIGETGDGRRFIAMPRYEGETLRTRISRGPLAPIEALEIARQVAAGLAAAHRGGIIHRDVTPANIFLTTDGPAKLLDFGIAALAGARRADGMAEGTVSSMSPEQARGEVTDARTDVWALGVVLFRMLTGDPPFGGTSTLERLELVRGPIPAPRLAGRSGIPKRVATVVDRALRKDPAARYPDAGAMLQALETAAAPRRTARRLAFVTVPLAAAALGAALTLRPAEEPGALPAPKTLVLLPVDARESEPEAATLAEAVLDDVGRRLTVLGRLRVVSGHSASAAAEGDDVHLLSIRLEGDSGGGHRLHATVLATEATRLLWNESRPFDPAALRELSRDLAEGTLRALGLNLTPRERAALTLGFPSSVDAYRDLLAGNHLLKSRTPEHVLAGIERYRAAHTRDTTYVSGLARHAYAIALLLDWGWSHPTRTRQELLAEGLALSDRALMLDSAAADAWLARAYLRVAADPFRMAGAAEAFRRAIALDPYNAEAYHQYAQTEMQLGRVTAARGAYRRAIELEPDAAMSLVALAGLAELQGRRREALRLLDSAVAVAPEMGYAWAVRSLVRAYMADYLGARDDAAKAIALGAGFELPGLAAMAIAEQGLGNVAAAANWQARARGALADTVAPTPDEAHLLANAEIALGRLDGAIEIVERTRPRGATLWYLFLHPVFDELQRDPVAAAVLAEADPRR